MALRGLVDLKIHFSDDKNTMAICTKTRAAAFLSHVATVEDHLRQVCCVYPLDCQFAICTRGYTKLSWCGVCCKCCRCAKKGRQIATDPAASAVKLTIRKIRLGIRKTEICSFKSTKPRRHFR